jgi:hypothetical protein
MLTGALGAHQRHGSLYGQQATNPWAIALGLSLLALVLFALLAKAVEFE